MTNVPPVKATALSNIHFFLPASLDMKHTNLLKSYACFMRRINHEWNQQAWDPKHRPIKRTSLAELSDGLQKCRISMSACLLWGQASRGWERVFLICSTMQPLDDYLNVAPQFPRPKNVYFKHKRLLGQTEHPVCEGYCHRYLKEDSTDSMPFVRAMSSTFSECNLHWAHLTPRCITHTHTHAHTHLNQEFMKQ